MNNFQHRVQRQSGFSLLEALISLVVLSFGLLAIASFQTKLIGGSSSNKAQSEAMTLAQQKLDDLRGYTTERELVAKFKETRTVVSGAAQLNTTLGETFPAYAFIDMPTVYDPDTTPMTACDFTANPKPFKTVTDIHNPTGGVYSADITDNPLLGTVAGYSRQWRYCLQEDGLLYAAVDVSWTDPDGTAQVLTLDTTITWKDPAASVHLADIPSEPLVPSATGRAYLGDGTVTDVQLSEGTDNQDGTTTVLKANDGADVALVDSETKQIVLTLIDACKAEDGSCFEFVKIKGRVYFDSAATASPNNVYVLASDAAYCTRRGDVSASTADNLVLLSTPNGDYRYYDYTCYLGGGWYGNIGLVIVGNSKATSCVGDPNVAMDADGNFTDGTEEWKRPEVATRRVYRGMLYEAIKDGSGDYTLWRTKSGTGTVQWPLDASAVEPMYFSKGIQDSALMPGVKLDEDASSATYGEYLSAWPARWPASRWPANPVGHDYVLTKSMNGPTYEDCLTPLTRGDSNIDIDGDGILDGAGSLFAGMPTDFICLNDEERPSPLTAGYARQYPYLDSFNGDGDNLDGLVTTAGKASLDNTKPVYGALYECPYDPSRPPSDMHSISGTIYNDTVSGAYDLRGSTADIATSGTTVNTSDGAFDCAITASNATGTALQYSCTVYEWGDGWSGYVNLKPISTVDCAVAPNTTSHQYTGVTDSSNTTEDFHCSNLEKMTITGSLTAYMNEMVVGTTLSAIRTNADGTLADPVECTIAQSGGSLASFTCTVYEEKLGTGWDGKVVVNSLPADILFCDDMQKDVTIDSSVATTGTAFNTHCKGQIKKLTVSGNIDVVTPDLVYTGLTPPTVESNTNGACTVDFNTLTGNMSYDCLVDFNYLSGWAGTITVTSPVDETLNCTGDTVWSDSGVISNYTTPAVVTCSSTKNAIIKGAISVFYPSDSAYCEDPDTSLDHSICPASDQVTTLAIAMVGNPPSSNGDCTLNSVPTLADGASKGHDFSCSAKIPFNKTWSGTFTISTNGTTWAGLYPGCATSVTYSASIPSGGLVYVYPIIDGKPYCN